jgi:hypothetical protein
MHVGDHLVAVYADRYAPDQFESHVPDNLGPVQLVASGGIASQMLSRSADVRSATDLVPVGLVGDERGAVLNLASYAIPPAGEPIIAPRTIAVVGTSMNSGKTTTVHYLVHSLTRAGYRVGATKVTGTGSGGDYWVMLDAGAHSMLDFTDAGMASTYRMPMQRVEAGVRHLLNATAATGVHLTCVEVADGIYQRETSRLLESDLFRENIDAVIFAASDAMGAVAGVRHLQELGHDVLAVSGRITRAPLAAREATEVTGLPVLGLPELSKLELVEPMLGLSLATPVESLTVDSVASAPEFDLVPFDAPAPHGRGIVLPDTAAADRLATTAPESAVS